MTRSVEVRSVAFNGRPYQVVDAVPDATYLKLCRADGSLLYWIDARDVQSDDEVTK